MLSSERLKVHSIRAIRVEMEKLATVQSNTEMPERTWNSCSIQLSYILDLEHAHHRPRLWEAGSEFIKTLKNDPSHDHSLRNSKLPHLCSLWLLLISPGSFTSSPWVSQVYSMQVPSGHKGLSSEWLQSWESEDWILLDSSAIIQSSFRNKMVCYGLWCHGPVSVNARKPMTREYLFRDHGHASYTSPQESALTPIAWGIPYSEES